MSNDESTIDDKKIPTPYAERSAGRPKGRKDLLPRKPRERVDMRKRRAFLRELRKCGSISHAAASVNLSRAAIYSNIAKDPDFARMVDDNKAIAFGALEEYAYKRVIEGEVTTRTDGEGKVIDITHKPSSAALVGRLLDATENYAKNQKEENHLHIHNEGMGGAVSKLIQALGLEVNQEDFDRFKIIEGELVEK
jgi:hypothetical protein